MATSRHTTCSSITLRLVRRWSVVADPTLIGISLGWMMWNYLVSALQVGMTLVLYDGSPLKDPSYLWKLTDELKITVFGTR